MAVMHQLHYVESIKKAINNYRFTGGEQGMNTSRNIGHMDCWVEVLRQATMYHGDMSLIQHNVKQHSYTGYNGWGNEPLGEQSKIF